VKKGIVLDIDESFITLLTPEGQFLRARKQDQFYQIGKEIIFVPFEEKRGKWLSSWKGKAAAAAVLTLMIGGASLVTVYQRNQAYAYMSLDDESSIELKVNKKLEVIDVIPYNDDGEKIVESIGKWKGESLSAVSGQIMSEMKKQGVGDGEVVFSSAIIAEKNRKADRLLQKEMADIKRLADQHESEIKVFNGTKAERQKAKTQGVTLGVYKKKETEHTEKKEKKKNDSVSKQHAIEQQNEQTPSVNSANQLPNPPGQPVMNKNQPIEKTERMDGNWKNKNDQKPGKIPEQKNAQKGPNPVKKPKQEDKQPKKQAREMKWSEKPDNRTLNMQPKRQVKEPPGQQKIQMKTMGKHQ
jgi:hypothetical protein